MLLLSSGRYATRIAQSFIAPCTCTHVQERGLKRRGYRMIFLEKLRRAKQLKLAKQAKQVQLTWMEKVQLKQAQGRALPSEQHPRRPAESADEALLEHPPEDDVWIHSQYKSQTTPFFDALEMHREMMDPTIFNNLSGRVTIRMDLNLNTEKKSRFIEPCSKVVSLPHPFDRSNQRQVIAFLRDTEQQKEALKAGAVAAGGQEFVRKIIRGEFTCHSIDYAVCHVDMMSDIGHLRGILRKKFPTTENECVGLDVPLLVNHYKSGIQCDLKRDWSAPVNGVCIVDIGTLDMPREELEANMVSVMRAFCNLRAMNKKLGHLLHRVVVMVSPSKEFFAIPFWDYIPHPTEEAPEKVKKRKKKASV